MEEENDNESIVVNKSDSLNTCHSDDESPVSGVNFIESPINIGKNQIIFNLSDFPLLKVDITQPFEGKRRLEVYFPKIDLANSILQFIKDYCKPNSKYYCLFNDDLYQNVNTILRKYFLHKQVTFLSCKNEVENIKNKDTQLETIQKYHEGKTNHRGINETINRIREKCYWPNLQTLVQNYINKCEICLKTKYERNPLKQTLRETPTSNRPFEIIHMDVISLEKSKFLTVIDSFSKFAQAYDLKNMTSIEIAKKLLKYFSQYVIPNQIICDNGKEFNNKVIKEFLELHKVNVHFISIDNPNSNGIVERFHSTLVEHMRLLNIQNEYKDLTLKEKLKYAVLGYNNTIHSNTKFKPIQLIFGYTGKEEFNLEEQKQIVQNFNELHKNRMQTLFDITKQRIQSQKQKVIAKQKILDETLPQNTEEVLVKENVRHCGKITKPKYTAHKVKTISNKLGIAVTSKGKKYKLSKLKRPRNLIETRDVSGGSSSE